MSPSFLKRRLLAYVFAVLAIPACSNAQQSDQMTMASHKTDRELIVLAAPKDGDAYYADVAEGIFDFHVAYAEAISAHDDVLIFADARTAARYEHALSTDNIAIAAMDDIWMRDFGTANPDEPVMFRYTAAGQGGGRKGQRDADHVQDVLAVHLDASGLQYANSDLLNDGGNYVEDGFGRAVLSRKFLRDNKLKEGKARKALQDLLGLEHVAFIESDEQGGLEHADGVVAFIGPNTLVINNYDDDPDYAESLKADLRHGLPDVTIHEIVTAYDGSDIYDERFGSACGLYTNMLVTPNRIYLPQFNIPEDAVALEQISEWTDKSIIPVRSDQVCQMGGGVRCMSWQLRGAQAEAFKAHFSK